MSSLRSLLNDRPWEEDWPDTPAGSIKIPEAWNRSMSQELGSKRTEEILHALKVIREYSGSCLQKTLRELCENFEAWNKKWASILSWPPSEESWGQALLQSMHAGDEAAFCIALVYPEKAWSALQKVSLVDRKSLLPHRLQDLLLPPAPPSPEKPSARPEKKSVPNRDFPNRLRESVLSALDQVETAGISRESLVRHQRETLDGALKAYQTKTAQPDWTENVFLQDLMRLSANELNRLLTIWPDDVRFELEDPVAVVRDGRFWAALRDAEPEAQEVLINQALPNTLNAPDWDNATRLRMLRFMVSYAKSNPVLFDQRMRLWLNWGGQLHEKSVLASDREEVSTDLALTSSARSAEDWLREQGHEIWTEWLDARTAPPHLKTLPPRPRRHPK